MNMNIELDVLKIDPAKKTEELVKAISRVFAEKGFTKAVLGISGGIDSAVVAFLLVRALGKENVTGLLMPYGPQKTDHAGEVVKKLGIRSKTINIAPMVDAYFAGEPGADRIRRGNKMARERMAILYDHSRELEALVVGTGNRTEIALGYFTLHGDGASAVAPLASLYKMQVFQIAEYLGVPVSVISKRPSADLWEGQTDEDEIGALYRDLDRVLFYLDRGRTPEELLKMGMEKPLVHLVVTRMKDNQHKGEGTVLL